MTIKQYGGVFGRNPTFNNVTIDGDLIINGSVFTGLDYQGAWNASTNTPTLTSSVGTLGEFYIVSVAGATDLNGITNWDVGDWALFNGSVWQRVEGGANGNFSTLTVSGVSTFNDNAQFNKVGDGANFVSGSELRFGDSDQMNLLESSGESQIRVDSGTFKIRSNEIYFTAQNGTSSYMTLDSLGRPFIPAAYTYTTAAAANMYVAAGAGQLFRSTSSLRYKNTVEDATHGLTELLTLRPVTYKGNNDGDTVFGGLIAEEVHDAGLPEFVQYNEEGEPDALAYGQMVSLCIKAIQEQQAVIEALTTRIVALES